VDRVFIEGVVQNVRRESDARLPIRRRIAFVDGDGRPGDVLIPAFFCESGIAGRNRRSDGRGCAGRARGPVPVHGGDVASVGLIRARFAWSESGKWQGMTSSAVNAPVERLATVDQGQEGRIHAVGVWGRGWVAEVVQRHAAVVGRCGGGCPVAAGGVLAWRPR
jgi:hypothetical protein